MRAVEELAKATLIWLGRQRLVPTPENYRLGFNYLDRQETDLNAAIEALTDGGVRLTQSQADELYERFFGVATSSSVQDATHRDIRHQALRLSDLLATAGAVTRDFGRALSAQLPMIEVADVSSLRELFASTIDRADRAERELASTTSELNVLREQFEVARGDAERDALTGLPNRRGIDAHLRRLLTGGRPFSLAICDIDHFKRINDKYGHAVGDRVLKTVAAALTESCAPYFIGRWGGEEFIVVAETEEESCFAIVARAKDELAVRHFKLRENDEPLGRITFSAGVTSPDLSEPDAEPAFIRADALLYQAKRRGRDRIERAVLNVSA